MTTMSLRKVTQDICNPQDLASQIFAHKRIYALRILDQMALLTIKGIKVENCLLQIEVLITHSVTLKRHEEVFIS